MPTWWSKWKAGAKSGARPPYRSNWGKFKRQKGGITPAVTGGEFLLFQRIVLHWNAILERHAVQFFNSRRQV